LSLLPVVVGVGITSCNQARFRCVTRDTTTGNVTSTTSKNEDTKGINTGKTGLATIERGDTFRLLTTIGAAILLPIAVARESSLWLKLWRGATVAVDERDGGSWTDVARHCLFAALCWNAYYDLSFRLLDQLHPITHAVGNTFKRVFVIGAGAFAFGGDLGGVKSMVGSALAVLGVLGYS
ncbi:unnamed protein product, partial [Sphacelaria rigidula]